MPPGVEGPRADGQHEHRGVRAVQRMVEYAPSSGGLALWVRHQDSDDVESLNICTDGLTVFYGPAFEDLSLEEQTGWVAHEVLHIALRHAPRQIELQQRLGDVDAKLFNLCADAIVNSALSHLGWLRLPARALKLEDLLQRVLGEEAAPESALLEWDVERLYRALDDRRASSGNSRRDGPRAARVRTLASGTARDLFPASGDAQKAEGEAESSREWSERLLRAHAGDGAHSMLRVLLADLPRVRTPWEQVLRTQFARALSHKPGLSWSRPTRSYIANQGRAGPGRRLPWEPGRTASQAVPRVVLVVDNSGSIDDGLLRRFSTELQALTRRLEAALVLVVGDDQVREVRHFEPGRGHFDDLAVAGGGGTDFSPLLEEASKHAPDLIVVLTDLDGPARYRPRCPVLWAVTEAHAAACVPFGRLLVLR
jgi:predicted metal-dependent peptidase